MNASHPFIGLMSGTSADSIDAVLVVFEGAAAKLVEHHTHPISPTLKRQILDLCQPGEDELDRMGELDRILGLAFATAVHELLEKSGVSAEQVRAIGSHGQTVRHRPPGSREHPFTLQIGDPNTIAHETGITTVADFRRRDVAAGGHGAPLAPAFHKAVFGNSTRERVIVNIGGMANVTHLPSPGVALGFDTGPGNALMDAWVHRHRGLDFDEGGKWAADGTIDEDVLSELLAHPFLHEAPPKSTGRETFHLDWVDGVLEGLDHECEAGDVQATLLELTARSVAECILDLCSDDGGDVFVCGGGAYNDTLMQRLREQLPSHAINTTAALGIEPEWVEAAAFAWLARRTLSGATGNLPSVTGARQPTILGGVYPA